MPRLSFAGLIRRYLTGATLVRLVPISIVLVSGVALTTWTHRLLSAHRDLVVHTHEVIEMAKDVLIGLDDAETGQRGYLLSGERRHLEPYAHARERLGTMAATLTKQVADNAVQSERMDHLSSLMQRKLDELQASIAARDAQGFDAALATVLSSTGQATMDAVRREIGGITEGEQALLAARGFEVQADERRVQLVAVLIGLASLLTRAGVEIYLTRQSTRNDGAKPDTPVSQSDAGCRLS